MLQVFNVATDITVPIFRVNVFGRRLSHPTRVVLAVSHVWLPDQIPTYSETLVFFLLVSSLGTEEGSVCREVQGALQVQRGQALKFS
jgi:hypothetical protein